jgi:uncharacterized membrane protein
VWLDWARGVAVVLMVLAHVVDAWTREADRGRDAYYWAAFVGGLAAPAFLFLAGVGSALSGASKAARGLTHGAVTAALVRRGLVIFGLAFVFRLQCLVLGLGRPIDLLKVDILNVMGPSLMLAGALWGAARGAAGRVAVALTATAVLAFAAPLVRAAPFVDVVPAPLAWYLRPADGHSHFTLLPWMAFVTAGLATGVALAPARTPAAERRTLAVLTVMAAGGAALAWWASLQPTIYPPGQSTFWGASPAFFFLRLGIVALLLPLCRALRAVMPAPLGAGLATLGAASLFIYWVHVELVYGGIAILIKRRLPIELTLVATLAAAWGLAQLVPVARRWIAAPAGRPEPVRRLVARLL